MRNEPAENWNPFPPATWIAWLGATVMAAATMMAYAYATFDTRDAAKDREGSVVQRLDRMEDKIDHILEQTKNP
jgi:uncharacterized protein Yka (UPF0111/DUF47 family)